MFAPCLQIFLPDLASSGGQPGGPGAAQVRVNQRGQNCQGLFREWGSQTNRREGGLS